VIWLKSSFPGGIHPDYNKQLTADKPIVVMPLPEKVRLPFKQHLGDPCKSVVAKGDRVEVGQVVAVSDSLVSAPIHASVAGEVSAVDAEAIEIKTDMDNSEFKGETKAFHGPEDLRQIIREAGIVGLGGAAFPTHVKVTPPEGKFVEILILNGAECEPYLTTDHRVMVEQGFEILEGLKLLMQATGAKKGIVGIENNKPDAIANLSSLATKASPQISVVSVPVRYPQGGERQLVMSITGREVPVGGLPIDVGIVVNNVATAMAVDRAVHFGEPLISRVITVSGRGVENPKNLLVRLGTPIKDVVAYCGGLTQDTVKVINGGPMMGKALTSLDAPVTKGTSGILAFTAQEVRLYEEKTCIRCAACVDACPMRLLPNFLALYIRKNMLDEAEAINLFNCIECGCCSYVCPSKIPLVHYFQLGKQQINSKRRRK
jgi:electron transport complex protein RnfC